MDALLAAGARPDAGMTMGPFRSVFSQTPLIKAAWNGQTAIVEALLAAGAWPDARRTAGPFGSVISGTPLYSAAENGHTAIVEALLAAGTRVVGIWGVLAQPF